MIPTNPIICRQVLKSKTETFSVWDRNFQLAFWSCLIYAPIMLYDNPHDPFAGWSIVTLVTAGCGALGGVFVGTLPPIERIQPTYLLDLPCTRTVDVVRCRSSSSGPSPCYCRCRCLCSRDG
jgi:hypothetical protein